MNQAADESISWHRDVHRIPEKRLDDYRAGFEEGWRKCYVTLKAQGFIRAAQRRQNDETRELLIAARDWIQKYAGLYDHSIELVAKLNAKLNDQQLEK